MFRRLHFQLIALIMAILFFSFLLLAVINHGFLKRYFSEYENAIVTQNNNRITEVISGIYERDGSLRKAAAETPYFCMMMGSCVKIVDDKGNLIIDYCVNQDPSQAFGRLTDEKSNIITLMSKGKPIGTIYINRELHRPVSSNPESILKRSLHNSILLASAASVIIAFVCTYFFSRKLLAPIYSLIRLANRVEKGEMNQRMDVVVRNEIGQLASAFNRMSEAIAVRESLRKNLVDDVAHELRTPLASLRCIVDGMMDGVVEMSRENLQSLHNELMRLSLLVSNIGALAWAESRKLGMEREPVELGEMLKRISAQISLLYADRKLRFEVQPGAETARAFVEPSLAERALYNVLHNAFKFSPPGGEVTVSLQASGGENKIIIGDDGPGIDAGDLPHIFERFYRSPRARNKEGTGIGLTVSKELVTSMGGAISAENRANQGAVFTIILPDQSRAG